MAPRFRSRRTRGGCLAGSLPAAAAALGGMGKSRGRRGRAGGQPEEEGEPAGKATAVEGLVGTGGGARLAGRRDQLGKEEKREAE